MSDTIRLKAGLDLPISGEADRLISRTVFPDILSVKPTDFKGVTPRLTVAEGDRVQAGSPVFCNKLVPEMLFTSPWSGTVESIVRGEKRKLLEIRIKCDDTDDAVRFNVPPPAGCGRKEVKEALLASGLWPALIQLKL